jgi:hypothetical protein
MKKTVLTIFLLLLFIFPVFADDTTSLEADYPVLQGEEVTTDVGGYVSYIFVFAFSILGFVLFGALVYGGILFLTSGESPEQRSTAIKRIKEAFIGVVLLLSFYIILNTINPNLLTVSLEEPEEISYPLLPAGPYLCNFEYPGIDNFITNYTSTDIETRNEAIKGFHEVLKNQDDDKYCMEIKSPTNIDVGLTVAIKGTYFVVPDIDEEVVSYDYGMIFFSKKDGLDGAMEKEKGIICKVSTGASSGFVSNFRVQSVAPVRTNYTDQGEVILYEGYNFNNTHPKNTDHDEASPSLEEVSVAILGSSKEKVLEDSDLSDDFVCGTWSAGILAGSNHYCGLRSVEIDSDSAPIIIVFKSNDGTYDWCNIISEDVKDLEGFLESIEKKEASLNGLRQVFKMDKIHLIKGNLMGF